MLRYLLIKYYDAHNLLLNNLGGKRSRSRWGVNDETRLTMGDNHWVQVMGSCFCYLVSASGCIINIFLKKLLKKRKGEDSRNKLQDRKYLQWKSSMQPITHSEFLQISKRKYQVSGNISKRLKRVLHCGKRSLNFQ